MTIIFQEEFFPLAVQTEFEDGGRAAIINVEPKDERERMFVRLQSWDDTSTGIIPTTIGEKRNAFEHASLRRMFGKKVRVTVEIMED